jgi:hypothetical protein
MLAMRGIKSFSLMTLLAFGLGTKSVSATEGAFGTYLLGSRDLVMGVVPPPGIYVSEDITIYRGHINAAASFGGAVLSGDTKMELNLSKTIITAISPGNLFGGTVGMSFQVPFIDGSLRTAGSATVPGVGSLTGTIDAGSANGVGDIVVVPLIGWHAGKIHFSFAAPLYFPTGDYRNASINFANRSIDAANPGKNRFAVDPTIALTYLNPATGHEFDFAAGVTFSEKNEATDYQTGAEFHFEATLAQRFASGWLVGVNGGYYQQLQDDSGTGADVLRATLGANDLKASFFGVGPVASYSTKIGDVGVTVTAKYYKQFEAIKHFEGDAGWLRVGLSF